MVMIAAAYGALRGCDRATRPVCTCVRVGMRGGRVRACVVVGGCACTCLAMIVIGVLAHVFVFFFLAGSVRLWWQGLASAANGQMYPDAGLRAQEPN